MSRASAHGHEEAVAHEAAHVGQEVTREVLGTDLEQRGDRSHELPHRQLAVARAHERGETRGRPHGAAQAVALAALQDAAYAQESCRKIVRTRTRATEQLRDLGFELPDSLTNFLFVHHPQRPAREIFQALRERDILVRYFSSPERVSDYLRITVGTEEEMDALATALRDILA